MFEMTENEFNECEQAERIKHDEKVKELESQNKNLQEMLQATRETRVNADYLKKIAELEKENKVLAQNLEDTEILNKTYEKRFSKLEKENAELKGEADSVLDNWCKGDDPCPHLKKRDDQLTKAKEIIKDLLNLPFASNEEVFADVGSHLYKAEQFLNEVEK